MDCVQAREAMSAQLDGERPGMAEALVEAHVGRCLACQAWREAAHEVTRQVRMTGWLPPGDLTEMILATARPARFAGWAMRLRAMLLVAAAVGQLVLTVPLLTAAVGGMAMDTHGMHELGAFDFALAVAFVVGALRPRLATGLAWPCCAAAVGLLATSTIDVISHHTFEAHELRHLIAVVGALLLCWTAWEHRRPEPANTRAQPATLRSTGDLPPAKWPTTGHEDTGTGAGAGQAPPAAAAGGGAA